MMIEGELLVALVQEKDGSLTTYSDDEHDHQILGIMLGGLVRQIADDRGIPKEEVLVWVRRAVEDDEFLSIYKRGQL